MTITLGFLASVLIILPGLVALAAFNLRAGKAGARRPEQTLTSISALVAALVVSLIVHVLSYTLVSGALSLAADVHRAFPLLSLGPVVPNPLEAFYLALSGGPAMQPETMLAVSVLAILQISAVLVFMGGDTLDLAIDRIDFGGRGWVFQHVTRPAENGYAPIGHVFTSVMNDGLGVAYKGLIVDVRQSEKGELLAVALARPERFLFQVGHFPKASSFQQLFKGVELADSEQLTGIAHYAKDYVGGVVAIEAKMISNIVVHNVSQSLLNELSEGEESEDGDLPG